eukprot:GGOE01026294.1.p2 GENE.GGOE01026294.1~~GGOE01026294.1.p2  ORF type:complete len:125 (+),score=33.08 GGOE01026294.1:79-453(+)
MKVDRLVKFHILPRDGVARAERMETWEDVKAQIVEMPPQVTNEETADWNAAAHSVGGFKRLVKHKVKGAMGRGKKAKPNDDAAQPQLLEELQPAPSEELQVEPSVDLVPAPSEELLPSTNADHR